MFHLAYAAFLGPLVHPPTGPASRVAVHMGSLSLAHPMLGQDAPQMPDGNALALFNDFGYDIPEMSSNISRYLLTIAQRVPGVSCTWGSMHSSRHRRQGRPRKRMRTEREREREREGGERKPREC